MPDDLWGDYDAPGWTANGIEPWGLQMDPIGADGNLFFKGWFLVVLGLYRRTTGDAKWSEPFDMVRDGEHTFSWSHPTIAQHLAIQWSKRPEGCQCENTKIWPLCLTAAGLGLKLFDLFHDTDNHEVFRRWWSTSSSPAGGARLVSAYDKTVIRFAHRIEARFHPPCGQSLFVAARRR